MIIPLEFTNYNKTEILIIKEIIKKNYKASHEDTIYSTLFIAIMSYTNNHQYMIVSKTSFSTGLLDMLYKLAEDEELIADPNHCIAIYAMLITLLNKKYKDRYTYKQLLELFDTTIPDKECYIHNHYLDKHCDTYTINDFTNSEQFSIWLSIFNYFYDNFNPRYILI